MRAFVAVDLPDTLRDALTRLQLLVPVGRRVSEENLHLTLAFLGYQPEPVLEDLHEELDSLRADPVRLTVSGVGSFGGEKPKIVFAEVEHDPALLDLRKAVHAAVRRVGLQLKRERFHPHITLSRLGGRLPPQEVGRLDSFLLSQAGLRLPEVTCESCSLFESTLTPKGAHYHLLARYDLIRAGLSD